MWAYPLWACPLLGLSTWGDRVVGSPRVRVEPFFRNTNSPLPGGGIARVSELRVYNTYPRHYVRRNPGLVLGRAEGPSYLFCDIRTIFFSGF